MVMRERARPGLPVTQSKTMNDLIYIGVVVVFFAASAAYLRWCETL
jgi:hypothetical protein